MLPASSAGQPRPADPQACCVMGCLQAPASGAYPHCIFGHTPGPPCPGNRPNAVSARGKARPAVTRRVLTLRL